MSINFVKIIELLSLEQKNDKPYLHIKIYLDQELELYWEIDSFTLNNLETICKFDDVHKYRLSLRAKADNGTSTFSSYVTKTYLSNSNRLNFHCSEKFKNQLELMKQCTSKIQLNQLPFLNVNLPTVLEKEPESTAIDYPNSTGTNEIKTKLVDPKSEQEDNNIIETSKMAEENKENLRNVNNPFHQMDEYQEDKALESLLKSPKPQKGKNKPGKWIAIASISLLAIIVVSFFILKPEQRVTEDIEKKEFKTVIQEPSIDSPSSKIPNLLTVDDLVTLNLPKGYVAFTFNEGPSDYTEQILNILKQYKVGATFFFRGDQVSKYPNSIQSVYSNRYAIGMTTNNDQLTTLPYKEQEKELLTSMRLIEQITNEKVRLFRPQAALFNQDTQDILKKNDVKLILWNNHPHEIENENSIPLLETIKNSELSGSIVFLQENQEIVEILPTLIEMAQQQSLKIVSLN